MNFYNVEHKYYCGIDLHAKAMYICIMDNKGKILVHRNIRCDRDYFLKVLKPYREDVVVTVECMFCWYWVADLCTDEGIPFVLGHCLYMKAIHGGKAKNDKIDSKKIAALTRGGMLPQAYVYPREMRAARDLMRRRTHFTRKRAELLAHVQMTRQQYNLPEFGRQLKSRYGPRAEIIEHFEDPIIRRNIEVDMVTIDHYDQMLKELEKDIKRIAKVHNSESFHLLQSIYGVGPILAMTLLYEIHDINRFPRVQDFLSYARLVKPTKESAGKSYGHSGKKIGNAHLKWAFSEAGSLFLRGNEPAQKYLQKLEKKHGKGKALSILSARMGRAVYFMLQRKKVFDMNKFLN